MQRKILTALIILSALAQSGCGQHEQSGDTVKTKMQNWCAEHNQFPLYPGATVLELPGDAAHYEMNLQTTDKANKVNKWYMQELSKDRWANWQLLRSADIPQGIPLNAYLVKSGATEISLLIGPRTETTTDDHTVIGFGPNGAEKDCKWIPVRQNENASTKK